MIHTAFSEFLRLEIRMSKMALQSNERYNYLDFLLFRGPEMFSFFATSNFHEFVEFKDTPFTTEVALK